MEKIVRSQLETQKAYKHNWYKANRERMLAKAKTPEAKEKKRARKRDWYRENIDKAKKQRSNWAKKPESKLKLKNSMLKNNFGITLEQFNCWKHLQGGVCAICKRPERIKSARGEKIRDLSVDHCHETLLIRGLLCSTCNRGLGLFDEDPKFVLEASRYLQNHYDRLSKVEKNR